MFIFRGFINLGKRLIAYQGTCSRQDIKKNDDGSYSVSSPEGIVNVKAEQLQRVRYTKNNVLIS